MNLCVSHLGGGRSKMDRRFKWWKGQESWVSIQCCEEGKRPFRIKAGKCAKALVNRTNSRFSTFKFKRLAKRRRRKKASNLSSSLVLQHLCD